MRWSAFCLIVALVVLPQTAPAEQTDPSAAPGAANVEQDQPTLGITIATMPNEKGVRVLDVLPGSPAEQIGVRSGDTILTVDGKVVNSPEDLSNVVNQKKARDRVDLRFNREGKPQTVTATLVSRSSLLGRADRGLRPGAPSAPALSTAHAWLGVLLGEEGQHNVVVRRILPGGPAAKAGLARGDTLLSIDGKKVASRREVVDILREKQPNSPVKLEIRRDGKEQTIEVRLGAEQRLGLDLLPPGILPGRIERGQETFEGPANEEEAQQMEKSLGELRDEVRQLRREVNELRRERAQREPSPMQQ